MALKYQNFIDTLLEEKGLTNLEPEVLKEIKHNLQARLDNWINARILEKIPSDRLDDFEDLLDKKASQEKMLKFLEPYIETPENFLASILLNFRATFLAKG